ncbi:hypothetical protein FGB62_110g05 [Gracilaria domingensis]|nr:hypothetical protein FGB62_110g05 [Gracilaria domingensis]
MYSLNGSYASFDLSTWLRSLSGEEMRTMPFRPELMEDIARNQLLNGILNNIRLNLGYKALDGNLVPWSAYQQINSAHQIAGMTFSHGHDWNVSLETINMAVVQELGQLDLMLNSSGKPWVYTRPYTFEHFDGAMARMKRHRISHGLLVIFAVIFTALHVATNSFVTHFDDVAYVAMRELIGHDCLVGPLADVRTENMESDLRNDCERLNMSRNI